MLEINRGIIIYFLNSGRRNSIMIFRAGNRGIIIYFLHSGRRNASILIFAYILQNAERLLVLTTIIVQGSTIFYTR